MTSFIYWHRTFHYNYNDAIKEKLQVTLCILFKIKDSFLEP